MGQIAMPKNLFNLVWYAEATHHAAALLLQILSFKNEC